MIYWLGRCSKRFRLWYCKRTGRWLWGLLGLLRDFPPTPPDEPRDFDAALEDAFAMGSSSKILIATPRGFKTLEAWARRGFDE